MGDVEKLGPELTHAIAELHKRLPGGQRMLFENIIDTIARASEAETKALDARIVMIEARLSIRAARIAELEAALSEALTEVEESPWGDAVRARLRALLTPPEGSQ